MSLPFISPRLTVHRPASLGTQPTFIDDSAIPEQQNSSEEDSAAESDEDLDDYVGGTTDIACPVADPPSELLDAGYMSEVYFLFSRCSAV